MCEQNNICVFCDHAGMRDDICGTYCVGGFWKNPDGTCDHYKEHQTGTAPARRTSQEELVKALRQMGVLTGGLMCVCCGHEHSCGINGCAVIEAAADALEAQAAEIENLKEEIESLRQDQDTLRNALCLKCGTYKYSHVGACDGCRWKKEE